MLSVFRNIRALITKGWCQWRFAEKPIGVSCSIEEAINLSIRLKEVNFSLSGAILASNPYKLAPVRALIESYRPDFAAWQDLPTTTKEDVLRLLDNIISDLETEYAEED